MIPSRIYRLMTDQCAKKGRENDRRRGQRGQLTRRGPERSTDPEGTETNGGRGGRRSSGDHPWLI